MTKVFLRLLGTRRLAYAYHKPNLAPRFGFFMHIVLRQPSPRLLRHFAGTFWIKFGGSSAILHKILGHTTQSTVQLYIHLAGSDIEEWHSRFSPADRVG